MYGCKPPTLLDPFAKTTIVIVIGQYLTAHFSDGVVDQQPFLLRWVGGW